MQIKLLGIFSVDNDIIDQQSDLLHLSNTKQKNGSKMGQYMGYLHTSKKTVTQSEEKYCMTFSFNFVYL
jgi:hypothetical protein